MIQILDDLQSRLAEITQRLHAEVTVKPTGRGCINHPQAKKNILWYVDSFAGAVAGARLHLRRVEEDENYTETDKTVVRSRIASRLEDQFRSTPDVLAVYDYSHCHERNLTGLNTIAAEGVNDETTAGDTVMPEEQQRVIAEGYEGIFWVHQAIDPLRKKLRRCIIVERDR